jgi:hypothetical protein
MPEAASASFPILGNLPSPTGAEQTSSSVESGVGGLLSSLSSMNPSNPDSPLRSIASSLDEVGKRLNFDPEPLRKLQPDALYVMRNAIPSDTLEFVNSIETAYREAQEFLQNSALAREIKPGATLQDVALAAVKDVLRAFDERQLQLHQNLIDPAMLADFQAALAAYEQFRTDFNAHRADFLPFITRQLFGVAPDFADVPANSFFIGKSAVEHRNAFDSTVADLQIIFDQINAVDFEWFKPRFRVRFFH